MVRNRQLVINFISPGLTGLNEAAGAADASRSILSASCPSITHRLAVLAHAHFSKYRKTNSLQIGKKIEFP
jgi:hypothetical protein